jgi:hypothetical protein
MLERDMSDAVRLDQRIHHLFEGLRRRQAGNRAPRRPTARETEQRAIDQLYGEHRSTVVVESARDAADRDS